MADKRVVLTEEGLKKLEEKLEYFSSNDNIEDLLPLLEEREAMKKLPAHYRRVLEYRLYGYSVTEIADYKGISHQAVSKMIKNAINQLRLLISNGSEN